MPSDAQLRVTDTLNLLQNPPPLVATAAESHNAHRLAQDYVNAAFPNPAQPAYTQFSNSLSLGFHLLKDPNERRRMTRALFLLWKAMKHYDMGFLIPYQTIGGINQGTVQRALRNYILKAGCEYGRIHGGFAGASHVLTQVFEPNPLQFLRDNKVFVAGSIRLDAAQDPQNIRRCWFLYQPSRDRYEFHVRDGGEAGALDTQVESVTAFHWTDARYLPPPLPPDITTANFGQMRAIQLSGAHPMVTTQFTGCSFCMAEDGGHMYCAHVSPAGIPGFTNNTTGNPLARRVMATGAFANAGGAAPRVYGRNVGSPPNPDGYDIGAGGGTDTYMTIVGFPGGATYNIYSQTTRENVISVARQIF